MARIAPIVDYTSTWPYPKEQDGWYHAHNALRADMDAIDGALATFARQLAADAPLRTAQQVAATRFLDCFLKFLHHHHHNEDDIVVPYLSTRFEVDKKVGADHRKLEELLERFEGSARKLLAADGIISQRSYLTATSAVFGEMRTMLEEHLREEEERDLPLMRQHFTPKEIEKHVVAKIMPTMDGASVGVFLRPMSKAQRRAFTKQEGIPFFIRWILFRRAAKYERGVWEPFRRECLAAAAAAGGAPSAAA